MGGQGITPRAREKTSSFDENRRQRESGRSRREGKRVDGVPTAGKKIKCEAVKDEEGVG